MDTPDPPEWASVWRGVVKTAAVGAAVTDDAGEEDVAQPLLISANTSRSPKEIVSFIRVRYPDS